MNISPSRTPSQISAQPQHLPKPKIAFTYQYNSTQITPHNPQSQVCQQQSSNISNIPQSNHPVNIIQNIDLTPRKVYENKQNFHQVSPSGKMVSLGNNNILGPAKYGNTRKTQNILDKSSLGIEKLHTDIKIINSPTNLKGKLPPLSPKISTKIKKNPHENSHNKCPSFLNRKTGTEDNIAYFGNTESEIQNNLQDKYVNKKCSCGRNATHLVNKVQLCCSKCGINKMMEGCQLQQIPEDYISLSTSPTQTLLQHPTLSQHPQDITLPPPSLLLQTIQTQKQSLSQQYKDLQDQKQQQNITIFYRQRKQDLKHHYEKIKAAIKDSIELDLKTLELMQKQQIECWRKDMEDIEDGIRRLEKIQVEVKEGRDADRDILQELQSITRYKNNSKMNNQSQTLNMSTISNTPSHNSSIIFPSSLKNMLGNIQTYKSQTYRMVTNSKISRINRYQEKQKQKQKQSNMFVYSNISQISSPSYQSPSSRVKVEKEEELSRKGSCYMDGNLGVERKNVLFSFQGKK